MRASLRNITQKAVGGPFRRFFTFFLFTTHQTVLYLYLTGYIIGLFDDAFAPPDQLLFTTDAAICAAERDGIRMNNGGPTYGGASGWGQPAQGQPGGAPQQGYAPQQQAAYPPYGQSGAPQQPGYQQGYQQQFGYRQSYPQQGGYQQQPGYQQGYAPQQSQQRWQQPGAYPPGAYPQGGYPPQSAGQQPNQGQYMGYQPTQQTQYTGYQPQSAPPKRGVRLDVLAMVVFCGVLPVLFVLSMVLSGAPALKWVFLALTVLSVVGVWVKPVITPSLRLTFTGVYGALAVVALVSALLSAPADATTPGGNTPAQNSGTGVTSNGGVSGMPDGAIGLGQFVDVPANPTAPPTEDPNEMSGAAMEQMESFFYFWSVNNQDNMVSLCAPSWQRSVEDPRRELFSILANRTPVDWQAEKISGTENDTTRTVTVTANIYRNNGNDPVRYRFQVIMVKENEMWYVDPRSLESHVKETATPTPAAETVTPPPMATANPNMALYYNPDGGSLYHVDRNCRSADKKYLPFKGEFTYQELGKHTNLNPCTACGAPLRE